MKNSKTSLFFDKLKDEFCLCNLGRWLWCISQNAYSSSSFAFSYLKPSVTFLIVILLSARTPNQGYYTIEPLQIIHFQAYPMNAQSDFIRGCLRPRQHLVWWGRWFVSWGSHMNARIKGFTATLHCSEVISVIHFRCQCRVNVMAEWCTRAKKRSMGSILEHCLPPVTDEQSKF